MSLRFEHEAALRALPAGEWEEYMAAHSGLPGPRGNLELLDVVGDLATPEQLRRWAASPDEYLATCGAAGLGRLVVEGTTVEGEVSHAADADLTVVHQLAADARWRVREGVAMALQRIGDASPTLLREVVDAWASDVPLVQRAAIAGISEPRLLKDPAVAAFAADVLDRVTASLVSLPDSRRRDDDVRTLRQALGYCWSVVAASGEEAGFSGLERWASSEDADARWIVKENLGKARLARADAERTARLRKALAP